MKGILPRLLNRLLSEKPVASPRSVGSVSVQSAEPAYRLGDVLASLTPTTIQNDYRQRLTRGELTYPCWALHEAIRVLPMLGDKVRFWTASLKGLDWTIKTVPADKMPSGFDERKAEAQSEALRKAYEGLNVKETVSHLSRARFYGFSILAKQEKRLDPLDPWCFLRDGIYGSWYWNGDLRGVRAASLPQSAKLDPARFVIREYEDPLILECLRIYINALNVEQWWNLNLEQESKRQVVVLAGNLIDKEVEFKEVATRIARGGSGVLDKGTGDVTTEVVFPPASRGLPYYENRLRGLDEQLTKSMTGSMLTMLTAPGAGTLAGNAHADTLKTIILAEAAEISAVMQEQYDRGVLEGAGLLESGEPALAYFELSARKEVDPGLEVQQTVALAQARYRRDVDELSERTGMTLTEEARPEPPPSPFAPPPGDPAQPSDDEDPEAGADPDDLDEDEIDNRRQVLANGDEPGHPFRDNQYEDIVGASGATERVLRLRETRVPVPGHVFDQLGIPRGNVFADYGHLQSKHPENFPTTRHAKAHVEYVFERPTHGFKANVPDHRLLVRSEGDGHKMAAVEIRLRGGKYRVRSAYTLTDAQMNGRLKNSDGPGAAPGIWCVNPEAPETPSRCWARLTAALPTEVLNRYMLPFHAPLVNRDPSVGVSEALGVPAAWLQPVADLLAEIEQKAADKTLSQADLLAFLDSAIKRLPELFADMDTDALAEVLEKGLGGAVLDGLRDALRAQKGA